MEFLLFPEDQTQSLTDAKQILYQWGKHSALCIMLLLDKSDSKNGDVLLKKFEQVSQKYITLNDLFS